jgi:acyl carrier protein
MKTVIDTVLGILNLPADTMVDDNFSVETCERWDSMAQISIVVALGNLFNTSFEMDEAMNMDSIGGIKKVLTEKGLI